MTATNHVATGMVIGSIISLPIISLPLAFLSHFALDSLPHFDADDKGHTTGRFLYTLVADMAVAASILLSTSIIQPNAWPLMITSGVVAASPDLMWLPRWLNELRGKPNKALGRIAGFHSRIQKNTGQKYWVVELVWSVLMIGAFSQLAF